MRSRFKAIPVLDGHGDELTLYAIKERGPLLGLFSRTRYELGTGEFVEKSGDFYVVVSTGEKLTPAENCP